MLRYIPKIEGGQIYLNFLTDLRPEQHLTDTEIQDSLKPKYFTLSMPLLTPNHSFQTYGEPEAFTMRAGMLHPENQLGAPLHILTCKKSASYIAKTDINIVLVAINA